MTNYSDKQTESAYTHLQINFFCCTARYLLAFPVLCVHTNLGQCTCLCKHYYTHIQKAQFFHCWDIRCYRNYACWHSNRKAEEKIPLWDVGLWTLIM